MLPVNRGGPVGAPVRLGPRGNGRIRGLFVIAAMARTGHDRRMPRRSAPRGRPAPTPDRRVVIVVFEGLQSLDLTGPLEVFDGAGRHPAARVHGGYAITVAAAGPGPLRTSSGLTITPDTTARGGPWADRHARGRRRRRGLHRHRAARARRRGPAPRPVGPPRHLGVQRRVPARRSRPARRAAGHHPLGPLRGVRGALPRRHRGARPHLRARRQRRHLRRRHRGDGPGARAGRGRPRARRGADHRPHAGAVPAAPGQPVAVQRAAQCPARRPRRDPRPPALGPRPPGLRLLGRRAGHAAPA